MAAWLHQGCCLAAPIRSSTCPIAANQPRLQHTTAHVLHRAPVAGSRKISMPVPGSRSRRQRGHAAASSTGSCEVWGAPPATSWRDQTPSGATPPAAAGCAPPAAAEAAPSAAAAGLLPCVAPPPRLPPPQRLPLLPRLPLPLRLTGAAGIGAAARSKPRRSRHSIHDSARRWYEYRMHRSPAAV